MTAAKFSPFTSTSSATIAKIHKRHLAWRSFLLKTQSLVARSNTGNLAANSPIRSLAQVRNEPFSDLWFTASFPAKTHVYHESSTIKSTSEPKAPRPRKDHKPPDERTLKLGKTLRTLSPLLPNIFVSPLPNKILSPNVSLHLFPSTHPHLPVVKNRVPCRAALWTAPVAWGSFPIVGHVKVNIISEKMVRTGFVSAPTALDLDRDGLGEEKLVVRWKTEGNRAGKHESNGTLQSPSSSTTEVNRGLSTILGGAQPLLSKGPPDPFTGLLIFSFDQEGKIATLTIEHADESNGFDKTSKVVALTDWLLGKARWGRVEGGLVPGLAYKEAWCRDQPAERYSWRRRHSQE